MPMRASRRLGRALFAASDPGYGYGGGWAFDRSGGQRSSIGNHTTARGPTDKPARLLPRRPDGDERNPR